MGLIQRHTYLYMQNTTLTYSTNSLDLQAKILECTALESLLVFAYLSLPFSCLS